MSSLIKWVGGKAHLLSEIKKHVKSPFSTFIDPFLGGGSTLEMFSDTSSIVADTNFILISFFACVKHNCKETYKALECLAKVYRDFPDKEQFYYHIREEFNESPDPFNFYFLIRCGFNGLYRVNSKGKFNVPWGKRDIMYLPEYSEFERWSNILSNSTLGVSDFRRTLQAADKTSLVYCDSPYHEAFRSYSCSGFSDKDHTDLRDLLASLPCQFISTNNDTPFIRELYSSFNIYPIESTYRIGRSASKELLITNR